MSILDRLFGREDTGEKAIRAFEEQRSRGSMLDSALAYFGIEIKRAYDMQRVGIQGRPQYPPTDIGSLFGWHSRNELVFACINKICEAAQDPEPIVEVMSGDTWERDDSHMLRRLLMKPNPLDTWETFIAAWMVSEHVAGVFYAEIVRTPDGMPAQLWPLDPCKVKPIPGKGANGSPIVAYEFKEGSATVTLKPEDVLVRRNHSLTNRFYGLSPLAVALGSVDADQAQTDYVRAFFNNGGIPSGLLKINRNMTDEEAEHKRQRWNMRYSRGGQAERGVAVLDSNAEYQKIGANLGELESDTLRGQVESRICMVFGVPPILVGAYVGLLHVNQRASAREAQADFWMNKMSPLFKGLRSFLTWYLLPEFVGIEQVQAGQIRVGWNMDQVVALQEDETGRQDRARKNFLAGGLLHSEFREQIGRDPDAEADFYLLPTTVNPVTGELVMSRLERATEPPPKQIGNGNGDTVDGEIVDDEKVLDVFEALERKAAALSKNGQDNGKIWAASVHDLGEDLGRFVGKAAALGIHVELSAQPSSNGGGATLISTTPNGTQLKYTPDPLFPSIAFQRLGGINPFTMKAVEWEGLTLSREPNETEQRIDLKAIVAATTEGGERVKTVLLKLRTALIEQAVAEMAKAEPGDLHTVVLTPTPDVYKKLRRELDGTYKRGRVLIAQEAAMQRGVSKMMLAGGGWFEVKAVDPDDADELDQLSDTTVARVVNQVQSTAAGIMATIAVLRVATDERRKRIEKDMAESSPAQVEGFASGVANAALQLGRHAEMEARSDEIDHFVFSSILDSNLCEQCEPLDGQESKDLSEMPDTPYPDCLGGDRCRCFVLAIFSTEAGSSSGG